jgi:hypothetical protein
MYPRRQETSTRSEPRALPPRLPPSIQAASPGATWARLARRSAGWGRRRCFGWDLSQVLVDDPHQVLQVRGEFPVHLLSLFVAELVGIRPDPLQQRNSLRARSLDPPSPRGTTLLRSTYRHFVYSSVYPFRSRAAEGLFVEC